MLLLKNLAICYFHDQPHSLSITHIIQSNTDVSCALSRRLQQTANHQRLVSSNLNHPQILPYMPLKKKISSCIHYLPNIPTPHHVTFCLQVWSCIHPSIIIKLHPNWSSAYKAYLFLLFSSSLNWHTATHRPQICFYPIWSTHRHL